MSEETSWDQRHQQLLRENEQLREFTETLRAGAAKNLKRAEKLESELQIATAERQRARDDLAAAQAKPDEDEKARREYDSRHQRMTILLRNDEVRGLLQMAHDKNRDPKRQAAFLIVQALRRAGYVEDNRYRS